MDQKIKIIQYTDPLCTWCYGMEPIFRKIDYLLKDKVEFQVILGMLLSDVRDIVGRDENAETRFAQFKVRLRQGMLETAKRTGVPIDISFLDDITVDNFSSMPMSLAYKAMHIQNAEYADKFLRRLREARYAENRDVASIKGLCELASEFPVDIERFKKDLTDGTAEELYSADLVACSKHQVRTYPTTNVTYDKHEKSATGYCEFGFFQSALADLTEGEIKLETPAYSVAAAAEFVTYYGRVMAREIQVLFDLSDEQLEQCVADLLAAGTFEKEEHGTSYFVKASDLGFCDPLTGTCSLA